MSDDYFAMSGPGPWDPVDRDALLDGVSDDLLIGANNALDGVFALRVSEYSFEFGDSQGPIFQQMNEKVSAIYREFSAAKLDDDTGLQSLINRYTPVWKTLEQEANPSLAQAKDLLEEWHGEGANAAKGYIGKLTEAYGLIEQKITVLEADVVAAREAVASARHDLNELGYTLKQTAEQYKKDKKRQAEAAHSKVLAAAFTGLVTGLLTAATMGVGEVILGTSLAVSRGAVVAASGAGSAIGEMVQKDVAGDNAYDIFASFTDSADRIRTAMEETSGELATKIHGEISDMPVVPPPPDVSPGDAFDPSDFETGNTSRGTEQNVRDADVDINPDGSVSTPGSKISEALDG